MAYSRTQTSLQLNRWAELMGISPVIFNGGYVGLCSDVFSDNGTCDHVWPQEEWQSSSTASREALAEAIASAEEAIKYSFSTLVRPDWTTESHSLTLREGVTLSNGKPILLRTRLNNLISLGTRGQEDYLNVDLAYVDNDSDGFSETAYAVFTPTEGIGQLHSFYEGIINYNCNLSNLVPHCVETLGNGDIRLTFNTWDLIRPELLYRYPTPRVTPRYEGVDLCDPDNLIEQLTIRYTYHIPNSYSVTVYGTMNDCTAPSCEEFEVPACAIISDHCSGYVQVHLDPANCDVYNITRLTIDYLSGCECNHNSMDTCFERAIAFMAAARLFLPVCECGCDENRINQYRTDFALVSPERYYRLSRTDANNPFGLKYGEVLAWRELFTRFNEDFEFAIII